jgi:hypothetical protein
MRIIYKILVIVFVAIVVGGMFYGVVTASSSVSGQVSSLQNSNGGQFPANEGFSRPD